MIKKILSSLFCATILMGADNYIMVQQPQEKIDAILKLESQIKKIVPIKVGDGKTMNIVDFSYDKPNNSVVFSMEIDKEALFKSMNTTEKGFEEYKKETLQYIGNKQKEETCNNGQLALIILADFNIVYDYKFKDGQELYKLIVNKKTCGFGELLGIGTL